MSGSQATTEGDLAQVLASAVDRRRNFAIISHPDAGKTTLTEKLLLYGGAIQQAGAVKARGEQRKVTSDWMELCLLYTSPSPRDKRQSRMPSSA